LSTFLGRIASFKNGLSTFLGRMVSFKSQLTMSESRMKRINPVRYLIKRVNYIKEQLSNGVKGLHRLNKYSLIELKMITPI
jgi:hypothetical protein